MAKGRELPTSHERPHRKFVALLLLLVTTCTSAHEAPKAGVPLAVPPPPAPPPPAALPSAALPAPEEAPVAGTEEAQGSDLTLSPAALAPSPAEEPENQGPRLGSIGRTTWIYSTPRRKTKIGYVRPGSSVVLKSPDPLPWPGSKVEAHKRPSSAARRAKAGHTIARGGCKSSLWYEVLPRGYICGDATTTLDLESDLFRALAYAGPSKTGADKGAMPLRYAFAMGAPMYGRIPREREQRSAERRRIEDAIGRMSAEFRADQPLVTAEQIREAIPEGAALVEIFAYRPFNPREPPPKRWGARRYAAYVLQRRGDIAFADLGETGPTDEAAATFRKVLSEPDQRKLASRAARELDARVMQPLRALLGETRELYLCPDGALNLVPFAALIDEQGRYLIERYAFTYLTSGRELLRFTASAPPSKGAFLVAGPAFGDLDAPAAAAASAVPDGRRGLRSFDMGKIKFRALPGTLREASTIAAVLPDARVLLGEEATEGALRALHGPRILHIATHGFFLPSSGPDAPAPLPENPLLRAGLALAGANARSSGDDDGILTALEASALDLHGTKLVVLSACETGLGDATDGDGVYGLRRALSIAGAETQVLSLWKVKDPPTRALMVSYYGRLVDGGGRSEALRQAQLAMLHGDEPAPDAWASFIVSGNGAALDGRRVAPDDLRVKPGSRGCGCDMPGRQAGSKAGACALLGLVAAVRRRKARRIESC